MYWYLLIFLFACAVSLEIKIILILFSLTYIDATLQQTWMLNTKLYYINRPLELVTMYFRLRAHTQFCQGQVQARIKSGVFQPFKLLYYTVT